MTLMYCLHCGDCYERMSPIASPCPHIVERGSFVFCGCYEKRPEECVRHTFHARVCPIGFGLLGIENAEKLRERIDTGFRLTKEVYYEKRR